MKIVPRSAFPLRSPLYNFKQSEITKRPPLYRCGSTNSSMGGGGRSGQEFFGGGGGIRVLEKESPWEFSYDKPKILGWGC